MSLSPQDIVRREFREAFRGYNQADVDLFLDEVVDEFSRMYEENQKMKVRLAALQQEMARVREGRGGAPVAPRGDDATDRTDAEVRARVKRFLEDLLRQVEGAPSQPSPAQPPPDRGMPQVTRREQTRNEPFWAGE